MPTTKPVTQRRPERVPDLSEIHGVKSAIARKLGVTRAAVSRVWNGFGVSRRISAEIQVYDRNPARWLQINRQWFQPGRRAA